MACMKPAGRSRLRRHPFLRFSSELILSLLLEMVGDKPAGTYGHSSSATCWLEVWPPVTLGVPTFVDHRDPFLNYP